MCFHAVQGGHQAGNTEAAALSACHQLMEEEDRAAAKAAAKKAKKLKQKSKKQQAHVLSQYLQAPSQDSQAQSQDCQAPHPGPELSQRRSGFQAVSSEAPLASLQGFTKLPTSCDVDGDALNTSSAAVADTHGTDAQGPSGNSQGAESLSAKSQGIQTPPLSPRCRPAPWQR